MNFRAVECVCLFILVAGRALAGPNPSLPAIDLGLWQWTTTVVSGARAPSPAQLAQLPESVRAAVEAHARTAMQPRTAQGCLTEQKLREGFNLVHRATDDCSFRVNTSSATGFDELSTCHTHYFGDVLSHIAFSVVDRTTVHGEVEIHSVREPAPEIIKLEGKRLSADCGSVKP